jgi:hypothetical protein
MSRRVALVDGRFHQISRQESGAGFAGAIPPFSAN